MGNPSKPKPATVGLIILCAILLVLVLSFVDSGVRIRNDDINDEYSISDFDLDVTPGEFTDDGAEDSIDEQVESSIGKEIIHDEWKYVLREYWFSDRLPEGVTLADCKDYVGGWMVFIDEAGHVSYEDEKGESHHVCEFIDENGIYNGPGKGFKWFFVTFDMTNLTGKDDRQSMGTFYLRFINSPVIWLGYQSLDYITPEEKGNIVGGIEYHIDGYGDIFFKDGETRTVTIGYLIQKELFDEKTDFYISLDVWGYSLQDVDKIGRMYLR